MQVGLSMKQAFPRLDQGVTLHPEYPLGYLVLLDNILNRSTIQPRIPTTPRSGVPVLSSEQRHERNARDACRKRLRKLRRYCIHNDLNRMVTLTFARPVELDEAKAAVRYLINKKLQRRHRGFAYAYAIGQDGSRGLHVHLAVQDDFPGLLEIASLWEHGYVDDKPSKKGNSPEQVAGYLAKNLEEMPGWSFSTARSFQPPPPERHEFDGSLAEAQEFAARRMHGVPINTARFAGPGCPPTQTSSYSPLPPGMEWPPRPVPRRPISERSSTGCVRSRTASRLAVP
jgi:hypothetical protein